MKTCFSFDETPQAIDFLQVLVNKSTGRFVVVSPSWRHTKIYAEELNKKLPTDKWSRDVDNIVLTRGNVSIEFHPLGSGNKLRGLGDCHFIFIGYEGCPREILTQF